MKVFLMHPGQDFDPPPTAKDAPWQRERAKPPLPPHQQALVQDLALDTLFQAMAGGDSFLFDVAQQAVLSPASDLATIHYRQAILQDCLRNAAVVRAIYQIPIEAMENKRKRWMGIFGNYPSGILSGAVELMQMFMELLRKLKRLADERADQFASAGFSRFFRMIQEELNDDYFAIVQDHLQQLQFRDGVLLSARLGRGNEGADYVLRRPHRREQGWREWLFGPKAAVYSFSLAPRDDAGARALADLRDRGLNQVANAVAQSTDHINNFLQALRLELAFYVGCLNLHEQLNQLGMPVCFPTPAAAEERRHTFQGLYDPCLALTMKQKVVANDATADGRELVIITGANQGGKTVFLRSVGLAQLMMQCGMFVPADQFSANVCQAVFSHFKREEDAAMTSGKLDEELARMSDVVSQIGPNSLLLLNESFASTNEREGSEIGRQVINALLEKRVKLFFVTHLYDFARSFYDRDMANVLFLRAERQAGGARSFKIREGKPLPTSYGADLYGRVFAKEVEVSQ